MDHSNAALLATLSEQLLQRQHRLAVAESCTGGLLAAACTDLAGSSRWFDRGWVTYSNEAKQRCLAVSEATLELHGAVSEAVVIEMVEGAIRESAAQLVASISGIAGPDGGSADKPVGTVWIAVKYRTNPAKAQRFVFAGDRAQVRAQAVHTALTLLIEQMN